MTDTLRAKLNEHGLALQERELGPSKEPGDASAHPTLPQAPMPASWDLPQAPLSRFELSEQDRLRAMRSEAAGRQRFRACHAQAVAELDQRRRTRPPRPWLRLAAGLGSAWAASTLADHLQSKDASEATKGLRRLAVAGVALWGGTEGAELAAGLQPSPEAPRDLVPITPPRDELATAEAAGLDPDRFELAWYEEYMRLLGSSPLGAPAALGVKLGPVGVKWGR